MLEELIEMLEELIENPKKEKEVTFFQNMKISKSSSTIVAYQHKRSIFPPGKNI